ncbi:hypothetical protein [uncultured Chryseobacterium sp.]|uniref:hypothetical protein n=1 Tax=uncultured Chryseobacterium sp. TaxID=259322 RepID=UPI0025E1F3A4|nr:hypothetical protein [uncultured Chryseobacterium sp.]
MKKIILPLPIFFILFANAQTKKEEKFVESNNYILTSNTGILMQKYYLDTKAVIYSHEKELGENFNKLLILNQKEYRKAIKDNLWKDDLSKQDKETAKVVYLNNLTSKLENYKLEVLEKLDNILQNKK